MNSYNSAGGRRCVAAVTTTVSCDRAVLGAMRAMAMQFIFALMTCYLQFNESCTSCMLNGKIKHTAELLEMQATHEAGVYYAWERAHHSCGKHISFTCPVQERHNASAIVCEALRTALCCNDKCDPHILMQCVSICTPHWLQTE